MKRKKHKKENKKKNIKNRDFYLYPALTNTIKGKRYGYINKDKNIIIPFKFNSAYDFNNYGVAIVSEDSIFRLIDTKGNYISTEKYDSINPYKENRAVYVQNSKMGVLDEKGYKITEAKYDYVGNYNNGRAVIEKKIDNNYKYGYIDLDGNEIVEYKYIEASDFNDGFAVVKVKDEDFALIDLNGNVVNTYNYQYVGSYGEGLMTFSRLLGGPYGYINKDGEIVISPKYAYADKFNDGAAIVSLEFKANGTFGVIDKLGKAIYGEIYNDIKYLGEEKLALGLPIGKDKLVTRSIYAIADTSGTLLTKFIYREVGSFFNGLSYASDEKKTFFIDKNGVVVKDLPIVEGSGELRLKGDLIYADIDYSPYYLDKNKNIVYEPNKEIKLNKDYSIFINKYKPNINYLIYIPSVTGLKSKEVEENINLKLKEMSLFRPYDEDKKVENIIITSEDVLTYDYYGNFTILFYKNNILTLDLVGYYYPLGAAHGMPTRKTPTINLITGDFYKLEDLFKVNSNWKDELNKIIDEMIKKDPNYEYVFKDAFKGITENQDFYIDENNLYIYYPPYEIGPYSAGFITFKIPFSNIDMLLNKEGDFYKYLK
jgi:Protein of unknown function (DUF3298)/WG containing repeat/Deacetylase PdaC